MTKKRKPRPQHVFTLISDEGEDVCSAKGYYGRRIIFPEFPVTAKETLVIGFRVEGKFYLLDRFLCCGPFITPTLLVRRTK